MIGGFGGGFFSGPFSPLRVSEFLRAFLVW